MERSSFRDEERIQHQFDRLCQKALQGEVANYFRKMEIQRKREVPFSDVPECILNNYAAFDEYDLDSCLFQVLGFDIKIRNALLGEALKILSEKKREIILMSYILGMRDSEIARQLHLAQSTIHDQKKRTLKLLKKIMEKMIDEEK